MSSKVLRELFTHDPLQWVMGSDEPYARWVVLTEIYGLASDAPDVRAAHAAVLLDKGVRRLLEDLPVWGETSASGHHSPEYLPNRLNMLADMGLGAGDSPEIESRLDDFLEHQDPSGRFESFGRLPKLPKAEWTSMPCDTNVITDVLLRFGRGDDERVHKALARIEKDASMTPQGRGWRCLPEKQSMWRGPGRKADACPQVTLEGLRAFSRLPENERPKWTLEAARTPLEIWRRRTDERPYAFGHGYQFKSVKWPNLWYDVMWVLETVSRFPNLWKGEAAEEADRKAIAEMAACLIAYNLDEHGRVVPQRTYRGFEEFSFGQKKEPSPFATARVLSVLSRFEGLAEEILRVDVNALPSSKGGTGSPRPPKKGKKAPPLCPIPEVQKTFPSHRARPRIMARHHLGTPWVSASPESVVADIVGLHSTSPTSPYLSLLARLENFRVEQLDKALYDHRSLVRLRCFRGRLFVLRHDLLVAAFNATRRQVVRYAKDFAYQRGVTDEAFEQYVPVVMEVLEDGPLTIKEIRERIGSTPGVDLAALVNRMSTECLLLRDRPREGWKDRRWTYRPFSEALPDIRLDSMSEEDADVAVVRAYIRGYAPVTAKDVSWWTGIGWKRSGRALKALGDEIVTVDLEGEEGEYLIHATDVDELSAATMIQTPSVALLPSLDPVIMGYADKKRFVPDATRPYVFDRSGYSTSVILLDGVVAGVWDADDASGPEMLVHLFDTQPSEVVEAIEGKAVETGRFLFGEDASVRWVEKMQPFAERPAGTLAKPLRP